MEQLVQMDKKENLVDNYDLIFGDVKNALVVVAHPDDMDISFGGTVARLVADGKGVRVLVCTSGAMGSRENEIELERLAEMRRQEQLNGAFELGVPNNQVFILDNIDATLLDTDYDLTERIVFHMREFRPEIIMTHDPDHKIRRMNVDSTPPLYAVNHRDHRAVGGAVVNAVMPMARDISFFPEHRRAGLDGISVKKILVTDTAEGEYSIDISDHITSKRNSLLQHKTQLNEEWINKIFEFNKVENDSSEPKFFERYRYYQLGI